MTTFTIANQADLNNASRVVLSRQAASRLEEAVRHLSAGDANAALLAASEACHEAPNSAQAHYAYGQSWTALGRQPEAERAFAAAIQLAPLWADAWINYGVARYRQGAIEDAKTAMRQVLAFAPAHPAATANLAAFLRVSGSAELAEQILVDQLARRPDEIGVRLNRAADLLSEERSLEALTLLGQIAPPQDPAEFQHWSLQKALAELQLNRPAEASRTLDALVERGPVAPGLAPLLRWRRVLLAMAEGNAAAAEHEAEQMEAALAQAGAAMVPEHAIMAHFDLAKFWSRRNRPPRAFPHWKAGHDLLRQAEPFSRDAHRDFVDASIASFNADRFAAGGRGSNPDRAPVFVVGMPRSGTTLVEQILDAHRDAHGVGERIALSDTVFRLADGLAGAAAAQRIAELHPAALDLAAAQYLSALHALAPQAARIVDKMPGNFLHLGLIGRMLPGARIIHCTRDPRDIGLSIFTFRFHGQHSYAHDLADLGWYIGAHDRIMAHWKAVLPNAILTIRLSDWVTDFDATLARVLAFLDLPPDGACARFYESEGRVRTVSRAQVRQPVNAHGLGRWHAYAQELSPLIAELEAAGSLQKWATGGLPREVT